MEPNPTESEVMDVTSDLLFTELPYASRWQKLMLALCTLSTLYSGLFVISPSFYRFQVPHSCANQNITVNLKST